MIDRPIWRALLAQAWQHAPVAWLSGVRRVGKTTLAQALPDTLYLNCDLPSVASRVQDAEAFFASVTAPMVVFDEVHQLADPSRLLKIGADTRPGLKLLATGSSTLAATRKFRDSLTGRKRAVHLLPVLAEELPAFGVADLRARLFHGGLPPALLSERHEPEFYREWLDSYFARDVQELFHVEKRAHFLALVEWLLRISGGLIDYTSLAKTVGISRPTVLNWIEVLEVTHVIHLLRPFHGGGRQELLQQPKLFGFDTGFVAQARGWSDLRTEDCGLLWEHLVLDTLLSIPALGAVHFWRDKQQREIDFVIPRGRGVADAIECKWNAAHFSPRALAAFRTLHPKGRNYLVTPQAGVPLKRQVGGFEIHFVHAHDLRAALGGS